MNHPLLLELNTRCWLRSLSDTTGHVITLAGVPDAEFRRWEVLGFSHVWLMGVWTTGSRSRGVTLAEPGLRARFQELLPGSSIDDLAGSPYAIEKYEVPAALGGENGLKIFREKLNARGIKLILDFVANHAGLDHAGISERPERFVQSPVETPGTFRQATVDGPRWFAHGRDPYFPPWRDTVQFDYRQPETRAVMRGELEVVASRCDGVRCDLAMLQLNDVFAKTWAGFPVSPEPMAEFWLSAIRQIKSQRSDFLFLAEAYWGLESRMLQLGFDHVYHKQVYDAVVGRQAAGVREHLLKCAPGFLSAGAHFLENHDEPRIAAVLTPEEHRAAALLMLGLPGMRMIYEGQWEGRRLHVPVQFARWPDEPVNPEIQKMYERWLAALKDSAVGRGEWKLLPADGADGVVVVQWQNLPDQFDLVVVNLSAASVHCRVRPEVAELPAHDWLMEDPPSGGGGKVAGHQLQVAGLALDLPAHAARLLRFSENV